jgi:hypothetical protein
MLPSPSPEVTATAMWGPILSWSVLELLAKSIDPVHTDRVALDLFDCLRLREPFAQALKALGFEDEESWRVAARIKVGLLTEAGIGAEKPAAAVDDEPEPIAATLAEPEPAQTAGEPDPAETEAKAGIASVLWSDPDVRWLCGIHEAKGCQYLVRENYEELLWWLTMPELLKLSATAQPDRAEVQKLSQNVATALADAEAAGYRIEVLAGGPEADCQNIEAEKGETDPLGAEAASPLNEGVPEE